MEIGVNGPVGQEFINVALPVSDGAARPTQLDVSRPAAINARLLEPRFTYRHQAGYLFLGEQAVENILFGHPKPSSLDGLI
jgi:hypothetical protein